MHFHRLSCIKNTPFLNALTAKGTAEAKQYAEKNTAKAGECPPNDLRLQRYWERVKALKKLKVSDQVQKKQRKKLSTQECVVVKSVELKPSELKVKLEPQAHQYYARAEHKLSRYIMQMEYDQARNVQTRGDRIHDTECLPYILDALNADGANIMYFPDAFSFIKTVSDLQMHRTLSVRLRGILAQDGSTSIGHHLFSDIYVEDGKASVIMFDSIRPSGMDGVLFEQFDSLANRVVASYWNMGTQNSSANCVIFALSNAKKAIDEKDFLLGLHKMQINNTAISAKPVWSMDCDPPDITCWDFLFVRGERTPTSEDRNKYVLHYPLNNGGSLRFVGEGAEIFPARFFKHAESKSVLERLQQLQPNLQLETKEINKKNQTIFERWEANKTTRATRKKMRNSTAYEVRQLTYSRSIEEKRLSFLRCAFEHVVKMKRALGEGRQPASKNRVTFKRVTFAV